MTLLGVAPWSARGTGRELPRTSPGLDDDGRRQHVEAWSRVDLPRPRGSRWRAVAVLGVAVLGYLALHL